MTETPSPITTVGIIGLGYVGLPLATAFAEAGVHVIGYDLAEDRVASLNAGSSYIEDVPSERLAPLVRGSAFEATSDPARLAVCGAQLICVPTPLGQHREPDLTYVRAATETALANLAPRTLVVLESTTWPGTTREVLAPMFEAAGLSIGDDVLLAFSPERVDPGNTRWGIRETPKVVGGMTPACSAAAQALYSVVCDTVHVVSTPESAEMSKIIENTYRAVNIALVNELAVLAGRMGIDIWEAIEAASTKPFGFTPFWPGPGLGGHCIPIDPFYLAWRARAFDMDLEFVELAGRVNVRMPYYAASRIAEALNANGTAVSGASILLLGMSYKADIGDLRESPSLKLLELLRSQGAHVTYHDPHVDTLADHDLASVELTEARLAKADCVVIATDHRAIDLALVVEHARLVVDLRNAVRNRFGGAASGSAPANVDVL